MPCVYDETPEEKALTLQKELQKLADLRKEQLDSVTDMLCRVMAYAEEQDAGCSDCSNRDPSSWAAELLELHPGLPKWWAHHKEADARRQAIEAAESELRQAEAKLKKLREEE